MTWIRNVIVAAAIAALTGCGGGGGGGGTGLPPVGGGGFALTPSTLAFTYVEGDSLPAAQAMHATWTATDAYYLAVALPQGSSLPSWLPAPGVSGSGGSGTVSVSVYTGGLAPGTYTASFMVGIARSDGSPIGYRDATVTLVVHPAPQPVPAGTQLRVSAEGVALTSTPGLSRLSRALSVATNRSGPAVAWTATASQGWLHVTAAGAAGDPLVLTADPAGLASDAVHEATVTVGSADPALSVTSQVVRVGLWVGADTPEAVTTVTTAYRDLAADPVRPYVYLVDDTATITIRNVHTGAVAGTLTGPVAAVLRSPTVSADGTRLYAIDPGGRQVSMFDLGGRTLLGSWPVPAVYDRIVWARIDGLAALLSTSGEVYVPESGAVLATLPWINGSSATLAVSRDATRVCTADLGVSPYQTHCAALGAGVGALGPAVLVGATQSRWNFDGGAGGLALTPDGARLFEAGGSTQLRASDATSAALATAPFAGVTTAYLGAVAVGLDGRVYAGGWVASGTTTLWAWDGAGTPLWSRELGTVLLGRLALSGDGLRLLALTGADSYTATALKVVTLP